MVLVVVTLTWALIRLAPGSFYEGERPLPPAIEQNIRAKYGLDKPWYVQYGKVMSNILRLDFGNSLRYENETVNDILPRTVPVSAALGTCAYLLALVVGITLGTLAALKQNSKLDYGAMTLTMLGISLPNFVLGPILVLVFALSLYWLPPARWAGFPSRNLILPVLTLSFIYMAFIARLTRAGMLEVLRSDYIRTARAKGLTEGQVIRRHAMRGGLDARRLVHGARARAAHPGHGGRRAHIRHAGPWQLLHQREPEPRRAAHLRDSRVHVHVRARIQPARGHGLRIHRSAHTLLI